MAEDKRTPTDIVRRELDALVRYGKLRSYRISVSPRSGRRRFHLVWPDGQRQHVEISTLLGIVRVLADRGDVA